MSQAQKCLQKAMAHHKAQRFQDAEKGYRDVLRQQKTNPDALRLLGVLYLQTGKQTEAVEFLEKAVGFLGKDPETLTNLGVALRGVKRPDDAALRFKEALATRPDYLPALSNLARLYHDLGKIDAAEAAFAELSRLAPDNAFAQIDYANVLLASGKPDEAVAPYERALKQAPDNATALVNLGIALSRTAKDDMTQPALARAEELLAQAHKLSPQNPSILNNLGIVLRQRGKTEEAVFAYRRALSLSPDYAAAAGNLAIALRDLGRIDEAVEACHAALKLRPKSADILNNLGTLLQQKGLHEEALASFADALALKPAFRDAQWNKSLSLLALGRYKEGWQLYESGLGVSHMRGAYDPARRWRGEDLQGKRLLIRSEQGFGDSLQFVRYAALCKEKGAFVLVSCPKALRRLFAQCPFIDALPDVPDDASFDLHVPLMSLPFMFGTELETIPASVPYLRPSDAARARGAAKIPDKDTFKVGLVWKGNPREKRINAHIIDSRRSMALETLAPVFALPGITFYSLQKDAKPDRPGIVDLMEDVEDFEDTAALIERLNLVISVDTSVAHLAGALGKPVWVLSRFDACWRWLQNRRDTPWYPTARVFGQTEPGNWKSVIEQICKELKEPFAR